MLCTSLRKLHRTSRVKASICCPSPMVPWCFCTPMHLSLANIHTHQTQWATVHLTGSCMISYTPLHSTCVACVQYEWNNLAKAAQGCNAQHASIQSDTDGSKRRCTAPKCQRTQISLTRKRFTDWLRRKKVQFTCVLTESCISFLQKSNIQKEIQRAELQPNTIFH